MMTIGLMGYLKLSVLLMMLVLPFAVSGQDDASPDTSTGNGLYAVCMDQQLVALCDGYIMGASDAFDLLGRIDYPTNSTNGQIVDVVRKYLADNPATRNEASSLLILRALVQAFPPKPSNK